VGFARQLGSRGSFRVDGIFREYRDFYAEQKDLTNGAGGRPQRPVVRPRRGGQHQRGGARLPALQTQIQYRFTPS